MDCHRGSRFTSNIDIAIETIIEKEGSAPDEEILKALFSKMSRNDALEILIFLPIAFCRLLLPNIDFLDEYYEFTYGETGQRLRIFSETIPYNIVLASAARYFSARPRGENILKIAGRSSEFHAINAF
jgi:hypothetical protein